MKEATNDATGTAFLQGLQSVVEVNDKEMVSIKTDSQIAYSPDRIGVIGAGDFVNLVLQRERDIESNILKCSLLSAEIKTQVAYSRLINVVQLTSTDPIFCPFSNDVCHKYILLERFSYVIAQACVLTVSLLIYVVKSRTGVSYTVIYSVEEIQRTVALLCSLRLLQTVVSWAH